MVGNYKKKLIDIYIILALVIFAALKKQYVVPSMYMAFAILQFFYVLFKKNYLKLQAQWMAGSKKDKYITRIVTVFGVLMLGIFEWRKSGLFDFSNGVSIARLVYICGLIAIVIPTVVLALYVLVFYWMNTIIMCEGDTSHPDERKMKISMGIIILA